MNKKYILSLGLMATAMAPIATVIACDEETTTVSSTALDKYVDAINTTYSNTTGGVITLTSTKNQSAIDKSYFYDMTKCNLTIGDTFGIPSIASVTKPEGVTAEYTMTKEHRSGGPEGGKSVASYDILLTVKSATQTKFIPFYVNSKDVVSAAGDDVQDDAARAWFEAKIPELSVLRNTTATAQKLINTITPNLYVATDATPKEFRGNGFDSGSFMDITGIAPQIFQLENITMGDAKTFYHPFVRWHKIEVNNTIAGQPKVVVDMEFVIRASESLTADPAGRIVDTYFTRVASKNDYEVYTDAAAVDEVIREFDSMLQAVNTVKGKPAFRSTDAAADLAVPTETLTISNLFRTLKVSGVVGESGEKVRNLDLWGSTASFVVVEETAQDASMTDKKVLKVTFTATKGTASKSSDLYIFPSDFVPVTDQQRLDHIMSDEIVIANNQVSTKNILTLEKNYAISGIKHAGGLMITSLLGISTNIDAWLPERPTDVDVSYSLSRVGTPTLGQPIQYSLVLTGKVQNTNFTSSKDAVTFTSSDNVTQDSLDRMAVSDTKLAIMAESSLGYTTAVSTASVTTTSSKKLTSTMTLDEYNAYTAITTFTPLTQDVLTGLGITNTLPVITNDTIITYKTTKTASLVGIIICIEKGATGNKDYINYYFDKPTA